MHEGTLLDEENFARVDFLNFNFFSLIFFFFTITVDPNPYPWSVTFF